MGLLCGVFVSEDQVLEQLRVCSAEDQIFDVVGKHKAKLTVNHVSRAVGMLWQFQKEKPQLLRTIDLIRCHPQFLTLRVLAENKIALMDNCMLVDMLYTFLRYRQIQTQFNVDPHDSLVQQLISEAWLRLDRLSMASLSKFAICLSDLHLQHSPLMGQITAILDEKLPTINDARILTILMISVSSLVSPRLRDALINRVDKLLDTTDPTNYNTPRRVVQFLRNIRYNHRPLLEKCNQILLCNIPRLNSEDIAIIMGLFQSLQFHNCDFRVSAKQRLIELIDSSTDPFSFTKLFVSLAPLANAEIREELENTTLLLADEFSIHQALAVIEALEEIQSRNLSLMNKMASVIQRNLHLYKPVEVARITQAFLLLQYQNPEFFTRLRNTLANFLLHSVFPSEVTMLTRVLTILPCPRLDDGGISRVSSVVSQCSLNDLNTISFAVAKLLRNDPSYRHNTPSKYVRLLQNLNRCGHERLRTADRLDLLLEELKYISGEWFEEMLLEDVMVTLQRMMDQINGSNVSDLALLLTRNTHLCPPLMEHIANVAIRDIDKIHHSSIYATLLPFCVLNYDPEKEDELFDICIQRSFDPHLLVLLGYSLALADRFPEELIKEIFSINFLGKLDVQLDTLSNSLNLRVRQRLMELNRAMCLECPEFQVPWFHDRYCQHLQKKGSGSISPVQQQIHKMLSEVLGGMNCVRLSVVTPYFYTVDFECILDKHLEPLAYNEPNTLQISHIGNVDWGNNSLESIRSELPPGAQRVAVDFLDSKSFCKNSHHMKGETMMRKRHLEILGYRVVQIPHFEWNSMELSTEGAWKEYLKKKIFGEVSS
uniref:RAP domain-containing protein n=1 Tax=Sphaeramia orbicularis TaxID=375764 RepID=A0A672YJZ5_9TELE